MKQKLSPCPSCGETEDYTVTKELTSIYPMETGLFIRCSWCGYETEKQERIIQERD
jgi:uncharacterized Zn finger protein